VPPLNEILQQLEAAAGPAERAARCEQALGRIRREDDPILWANLQGALASSLAEEVLGGADVSRAGEAIRAGERALEVYTYEATPVEWAEIQLLLGGLFRARPDGDRAENLERAATALDAALRVFTHDAFPDEWLQAHYHRGPVQVFRTGGDRNENLRRALESLRIAVAGVPREDAPDVWAALQVTIAQALLDRTDDDEQAHIEEAIAALEAAVPVLGQDDASQSWILARRFLADAYLRREAGDAGDNLERGIQALEAVQQRDWPPVDVDAWTTAQANLGQAYARRHRGDRAQNRAKAIAALEAVMSAQSVTGVLPQAWDQAQAWLTLLTMHDAGYEFALKREPDLAVEEQRANETGVAALMARNAGESRLAHDPRWHVPFQLEEEAKMVQRQLAEFLGTGSAPLRGASERSELEDARQAQARLLVYQLRERQSAGRRTESLFREVQRDGRPFALFLRGFNNRVARFAQGSVMSGTGNLELFALTSLVAALAPMPVVWIVNPVESPALDLLIAEQPEDAMGFRVEAGDDWELHVRTLISAAACIVMHNASMTPGVVAEIVAVAAAGRLDDAFFEDPEAANGVTGRSNGHRIDAEAIRARTAPLAPQPVTLPPAMCPWVGGTRRIEMEREALGVEQLVGRLDALRAPEVTDLALDATAWRLAHAVLLERPDAVASALAQRAALFEGLAGEFDQAAGLAADCTRLSAEVVEIVKP